MTPERVGRQPRKKAPEESTVDSDVMDRDGIAEVTRLVQRLFRWIVREQPTSDYGIDLHAEQRDADGLGTGRMLALQVKSGPSYFRRSRRYGGLLYYPTKRHVAYWLQNSLPVCVVIIDPDTGEAYWVNVTEESLVRTARGHRLVVPYSQRLGDALPEWSAIVDRAAGDAESRFEAARRHLPQVVVRRLDEITGSTRLPALLLGLELAASREMPAAAVARFQNEAPDWFRALGATGVAAVADYAFRHSLADEALALYDKVVQDDRNLEPECLLRRATLLADRDSEACAETVLHLEALGGVSSLNAMAFRAIHADALDQRLPLTKEAIESSPGRDQPLVWSHAGRNLARAGQLDQAIELYSILALQVRPLEPSWTLQLAQLLASRSRRPNAPTSDRDAAISYAAEALDQALDALVDLDSTAVVAFEILESAGAAVIAYRRAVHLLVNEAGRFSKETRFVLASAAARAGQMVAPGDPELRAAIAAVATDDERMTRLLEQLDADPDTEAATEQQAEVAADRGDYQAVSDAVLSLALSGRDRTDLLPSSVDDDSRQRLSDLALAVAGTGAALERLRRRSMADRGGWETYALALGALGHWPRLLDSLDRATVSFGENATGRHRVRALLNLDREVEAIQAAERVLAGQPDIETELELRAVLARALYSNRDMAAAARQLELSVALSEREGLVPRRAWDLAFVLTMMRRNSEAAAVLASRRMIPETLHETSIWLNAQPPYGWTDATASLALDLVERFPEEHELSKVALGRVLLETRQARDENDDGQTGEDDAGDASTLPQTSRLDQRPIVDASVLRRAHVLVQARHGTPASPFTAIHMDFDDDPVQQLIDAVGPRPDPTDLRRRVLWGQLPAGLLTLLEGHPYGSVLIRGSVGVHLAAPLDDDSYELDRQDAASALDGRVVVEPSAIVLAARSDRFDEFADQFSAVLTPPEVRDDAAQTLVDIQGVISSSALLDVRGPRIIRELTDEDRSRLQAGAALYQSAVSRCVVDGRTVPLEEFAPEEELERHTWMAPLRLAKALDLPVWSDDVVFRRLARSVGLRAFGSLALAEAILEQALVETEDPGTCARLVDQHAAWNLLLVRQFVVYLPVTSKEIIELARDNGFELGAASLQVALGGRWVSDLEGTVRLVLDVLLRVRQEKPERLQHWLLAVLEGIDELRAANGGGSDVLAAIVGLVAAGNEAATTEDPLWRLTIDFCAERGIADPDAVRDKVEVIVRQELGRASLPVSESD